MPRPKRSVLPRWQIWLIRLVLLAGVAGALWISPGRVAVVAAGVVLAALAVYLYAKYRLRKWFGSLGVPALLPEAVRLVPAPDGDWYHPGDVAVAEEAILGVGFQRIGAFTADQLPGVRLVGYVDSGSAAYAALYDMEYLGVWADVVCQLADDSYLTFSNTRLPGGLERPPDKPLERFPDDPPDRLYRRLLDAVGERARKPASAADFVPTFERYQAEESEWQEASSRATTELERSLREAFLERSGWSAIEWDRQRERVVLMHDRLRPPDVVTVYTEALDGLDETATELEERRARELAASRAPRAAFAAMVADAPPGFGFEKVLSFDRPLACDAYLAPEPPSSRG